MPKSFVQFSFLFLTLTALSGFIMRLYPFLSIDFTYSNLLHAHSHLAMLGWVFLALFAIFLVIFWRELDKKREAKGIAWTLFFVSLIMFGAFLYQGYGVFSIIMSTLHIFVEYWAASFIYRTISKHKEIPKAAHHFIKASLFSLVLSSIGPFSLGYISANGLKDSQLFDMAIYFYLHFQYNGWMTLFLIGLFIVILHRTRIMLSEKLLQAGFWIYFVSLFPGYFLSILWVDIGPIAHNAALIGCVGQWVGVVLLLLSFRRIWTVLLQRFSKTTRLLLGVAFGLLFIKSTMELGLMIPSLADSIYNTRSIVIGYLHLTLLGFVSLFILAQYTMIGILPDTKLFFRGILVFLLGFLLNELLLFAQGLLQWLQYSTMSFFFEGVLLASFLLLLGILIIWHTFVHQ